MYKYTLLLFIFALMAGLLQSCGGTIYPGLSPYPMGPRIIQPVDNRGDKNILPPEANFVQSYTKVKKSKTNSNFGALVRMVEFEYDIADTIHIIPRLTTGYDEGQMTGKFTIILDQYELTYENKNVEVREYVEQVSYESSRSLNENQLMYNNPVNAGRIINKQEKQDKVINRSQLYNSTRYFLEPEDVRFLQRTKTLYYIIYLQNCSIKVYPTKEQIGILKRMITKHYMT